MSKETTASAMSQLRNGNPSLSLSSPSSVSSRSSSFRSLPSPSDEFIISPPTTPLQQQHNHRNTDLTSSTKAHVPFSWEHLPGIPKNQITTTPPPPPVTTPSHRRPKPTTSSSTTTPPSKLHSPSSSSSGGSSSSSSASSFTSLPLPPSSKSNHPKEGRKQSKSVTPRSSGEAATTVSRSGSWISWQDPFLAALMECSKDTNDTTTPHHKNHNHPREPSVVVKRSSGGRSVGKSKSERFQFHNPIANLFNSLDQFSCKRGSGVISEYAVVQQKGCVRHG